MKKLILVILAMSGLGLGMTAFTDPCAFAGNKECKASGEKCGLDKECCSKFCKSSNTLRTCK